MPINPLDALVDAGVLSSYERKIIGKVEVLFLTFHNGKQLRVQPQLLPSMGGAILDVT